MTIRLGVPVFRFSAEKMSVLLIFEGLAIAQLILSILMHKEHNEVARRPKSKENKKHTHSFALSANSR